jgi:2Fe-2S ferredoxin
MPKVTYISDAGASVTVDAAVGMSVMRAAVMNGVDGIDAECGGSCACATCHVIVDPEWAGRLPPIAALEQDTLELVSDPTPTSRLSCQLVLTAELDGLVVRTPAQQG